MRRALGWLLTILLINMSHAEELPQTELVVLGSLSTRSVYTNVEVPFWTKLLPADAKGRVTVEIKGFDEVGIKGPDLLKLTGTGVVPLSTVPLSYYLTDQPINEAMNIAGLVSDLKLAKSSAEQFERVLAETYRRMYGVKLLGMAAGPPQLLFCRSAIQQPSQLKGRTVRTNTRSQAELVQAFGAKAKVLAVGEVAEAFQNKTIDCAIAASMVAFKADWYKWAHHIYAIPLGWNHQAYTVNQTVWDKFTPPLQAFLTTEIKRLTDQLWDYALADNQKGIACLSGAKACPFPSKAKMKLVQPSPADEALVQKTAIQKVLPVWAKQCNQSCVDDFNATIGKSLGVQAKH